MLMRKRSKYRPKPMLQDPLNFVLESITPVAQHDSYLVDLKIKNHDALTALTKGMATRKGIDTLIQAVNIVEALYRLGFGRDYFPEVRAGLNALYEVGVRGAESGRFVLKASEMDALNMVMELHDAQLEVITVKDMDKAIGLVTKEFLQKKMRAIKPKEKV
jgi:hypothetical protein